MLNLETIAKVNKLTYQQKLELTIDTIRLSVGFLMYNRITSLRFKTLCLIKQDRFILKHNYLDMK